MQIPYHAHKKGCVQNTLKHNLNKECVNQPKRSYGKCWKVVVGEGGGMRMKISGVLKSESSAPFVARDFHFVLFGIFFLLFSFVSFDLLASPPAIFPFYPFSIANQASFSGRPKLIGSLNECSPGW